MDQLVLRNLVAQVVVEVHYANPVGWREVRRKEAFEVVILVKTHQPLGVEAVPHYSSHAVEDEGAVGVAHGVEVGDMDARIAMVALGRQRVLAMEVAR